MDYNPEQVLTAWKAFISQGLILEDLIRPEIARAWLRCKAAGLDPWSVNFPKPSEELLTKKRQEHKQFLVYANPIMQYLKLLFNSNISVNDQEGFIFELITPLDYYPRTLGTYTTENSVGCGNVPIALYEQKPVRVDGYEHYRVISQNYSGVSAPITDSAGKLIGTINMNNPFRLLPASALPSCIEAAAIIRMLINSRQDQLRIFATANLFKDLIELNENAVITLDQDGHILSANSLGEELIPNYQDKPYASQSLQEYLSDKYLLPSLLECCSGYKDTQPVKFKAFKGRKALDAVLLDKQKISLPNGLTHLVLLFQNQTAHSKSHSSQTLRQNTPAVDYIGQSSAWKAVDTMVQKVAKHKTNVLLLGETGTGKEVVARAIHLQSGRTGRFVALNCGSIPRDLLASELFGYEGGSFTGARAAGSIGKFEWASGGTLFLDEIGEMPVDMQVSLLRALQEQSITKIGSNKPQKIDTQIIAATNKDMKSLIQKGLFRSDLYYRLSVFEIKLPLLKERAEDIPLLAEYFNKELSSALNMLYTPFSLEILDALSQYAWPGNVRELKNAVEKMLIIAEEKPVTLDILPEHIRNCWSDIPPPGDSPGRRSPEALPQSLPDLHRYENSNISDEKEMICLLLEKHKGNISRVAREMGISRNTLYKRIEKLDIKMKFFGSD